MKHDVVNTFSNIYKTDEKISNVAENENCDAQLSPQVDCTEHIRKYLSNAFLFNNSL